MPALCPSSAVRRVVVNRPIVGNANFQARQNDLLARLASLEESINLRNNEPENMDVDVETDRHQVRQNRRSTRALRGQESIFKVPGSPPLRNRMPDYRRNPSRWTKYSLADVSVTDMSDRSNTAAAMTFLRSRQDPDPPREELPAQISFNPSARRGQQRARKEEIDEPEPVAGPSTSNTSVGFGDPCPPIQIESPSSTPKPVYKDSKLVMPEYVIGEKKPKPKKAGKKAERGKELALSHLLEQDDE